MIVSEIFLMLFLGFIIAEHNMRYIILGSKDSFFEYIMSLVNDTINFSFEEQKNRFNCDFLINFFNGVILKYLKKFMC